MPHQPPFPYVHYLHMGKNTCPSARDGISTCLILVRSPITRIISWFNVERHILVNREEKKAQERLRWKRAMLFEECHDDFVEFVLNLRMPEGNENVVTSERPINMSCPERSLAALLGVRQFSYHEWYNYEYYWSAMQDSHQSFVNENGFAPRPPSLFVLRTEHLEEDWKGFSSEELFRYVNIRNVPPAVNATNHDVFNYTETKRYWKNLCYVLCPEIQLYKKILHFSLNLDTIQVEKSIDELALLCPDEASDVRDCTVIPRFPQIKATSKEYYRQTKKRLFTIESL